jgi:hypothetical protein
MANADRIYATISRHHIAFSRSGRRECHIATAVERRVRQRNAWLDFRAWRREASRDFYKCPQSIRYMEKRA